MDGGLVASQAARVEYIVVDEGCGMDHLDDHCKPHGLFGASSEQFGRQESQCRSESFATEPSNIFQNSIDLGVVTDELRGEFFLEGSQMRADASGGFGECFAVFLFVRVGLGCVRWNLIFEVARGVLEGVEGRGF
jgi:hypothetical protein